MSSWKVKAEGGAKLADRDEVRRALGILIDPGQTFELRGLPSGRSRVCRGSDLDAAVEAAWDLSDGQVYYIINPCRAGLDKAAHNPDIESRRWLLIDCDPERPDRASATDAEKAGSIEHARTVAESLAGEGWPDPLWVDSGNGVHLLYRIDLPADDLSRQWLKAILGTLGDRFDTPGSKLDRGVHRAAQLAKLPGTWARKGPDEPDRPHRMARLVSVPATIDVVPVDLLKALAAPAPTPHANGTANGHARNPWGAKATAKSWDSYVRSAIARECAIVGMTPQGGRNDALNASAFNLGTLADWPEMVGSDAKLDLYRAAVSAGLGEQESTRTIESGWTAGAAKPRARPAEPANGKPAAQSPPRGGQGPLKGSPILWAKDVRPTQVEWIWERGVIPRGKLTTFAGMGGLGKTFILCDIAARISQGDEWPFSGSVCADRGKILLVSGEDDPDDTLVPRLMEFNADLSQIAFLSVEALDRFKLADLDAMDVVADLIGSELALVIIDPPTAYLGGVDDHNNAELRSLLTPLKGWVKRRNCGLIFNTHVNKASGGKVEAMMRVMGSVAWVNTVRSAHMIAKDPNDRTRRLFLPMKCNVGEERKGLAYRIVKTPSLARVEWLDEVDTTADEAMSQDKRQPAVRDAKEVLIEMFNKQQAWPSDQFWAYLRANGIQRREFDKARAELSIPRTRQVVSPSGDRLHTWWVPPNWPHLIQP